MNWSVYHELVIYFSLYYSGKLGKECFRGFISIIYQYQSMQWGHKELVGWARFQIRLLINISDLFPEETCCSSVLCLNCYNPHLTWTEPMFLQTSFEDVFPVEATSVEEYLQQVSITQVLFSCSQSTICLVTSTACMNHKCCRSSKILVNVL